MRATTATAANSGRQKRPRGRQQMDLFDSARPEFGGAPLWPEVLRDDLDGERDNQGFFRIFGADAGIHGVCE